LFFIMDPINFIEHVAHSCSTPTINFTIRIFSLSSCRIIMCGSQPHLSSWILLISSKHVANSCTTPTTSFTIWISSLPSYKIVIRGHQPHLSLWILLISLRHVTHSCSTPTIRVDASYGGSLLSQNNVFSLCTLYSNPYGD